MIKRIEKSSCKNFWKRRNYYFYVLSSFVSVMLFLFGIFVAIKGLIHISYSTKFEGVISQKYPCKLEDRCQQPWLYNFDIEIKPTNQTLRNFKVDIDTYQKYKLGDKYIVIQKAGENWFRPSDFVLEQWGWGVLGAILFIFLGGWGFAFFGAVLFKSHRLNFMHDICAATFCALLSIGGMYMVFTDIYTIHWGKQHEATIITKDTHRGRRGIRSYNFSVNVGEINKQFHKISVGQDFYDEHKVGDKVSVLVNPYRNSAIIRGGRAYQVVIVGLIFMFLGWSGVFYKFPKLRYAPLERRFPGKLSLVPKMVAPTRKPHKEFDLELNTVLGELHEAYKNGYKNFCIDIARGGTNILQIVSPSMFDHSQKHEMGFVVYVTFDGNDDKKEEFLKMPIAKEFVFSDMVEGVDCYGLNLNDDRARVVVIVKDLLLKVWGIQPQKCKVSWWAS